MIIFVYGTLKKNKGNHLLLETSKFLKEITTSPKYILYIISGLPVLALGKDKVKGELYEIDEIVLSKLDMLEGHPSLYVRKNINIPNIKNVQGYLGREILNVGVKFILSHKINNVYYY